MSRKRWITVLVAMFVIAGVSGSGLIAWLFYTLAAILAVAVYVSRHPARLQSATREMTATHAEIGQVVSIEADLAWERAVGPGWILARDSVPRSLDVLNPTGRLFISTATSHTSFCYRVSAKQRGYYPIGPLSVSCGDLFGIEYSESELADLHFLTVYPRVVPVPEIRVPSNRPIGDVRSSERVFEDPTRTVGVRDYMPGDNPRRIHWKATARAGRLESKVYEPSTAVEVNIVLNLFEEDYPAGEHDVEVACTAAASLGAALLMARQLVGLMSNGADAAWKYNGSNGSPRGRVCVKADRSYAQLASILSAVARLEPSREIPLPEYLAEIHSSLRWTATLLIITHRLDDWSAQVLESLRRSGFALAVVIAGTGDFAEESTHRAASLSLPVGWVQTEEQLGVLEFWRPGRA